MELTVRNVNHAFKILVAGIASGDIPTVTNESRNGPVIQIPTPVTIAYQRPLERVLFNQARDCNPFFHLYESMWMLAGRNDVKPLKHYVKTIDQFSDDGIIFNGAYGYRWRHKEWWDKGQQVPGDPWIEETDQLNVLIEHLKKKPESRRAVLQMWTVEDDLVKIDSSKDVCCNTAAYLSTVNGVLDMTVTNRSNDLIWGALGANVVHFSFLQEYLAAGIGVEVGTYYQFTNNLHVYTETNSGFKPEEWLAEYNVKNRNAFSPKSYSYEADVKKRIPLVRNWKTFNEELPLFITDPEGEFTEPFFKEVGNPMAKAYSLYKQKKILEARSVIYGMSADDWRIAATNWLLKRS